MTEVDRDKRTELLIQEFWSAVTELFRVGNPRGTGLLNFIRRTLQQSRVLRLEEQEVLIDACMRAIEYIKNNEREIRHPASWLRQVAVNIIKEEVRKNINNDKMIHGIYIKESSEEDTFSDNELELALNHLDVSLNKLSSKDREILELRFYRKLSYKEIQKYLLDKGEDVPQLDALRKQMSRALKRLRREYKGISYDKSSC